MALKGLTDWFITLFLGTSQVLFVHLSGTGFSADLFEQIRGGVQHLLALPNGGKGSLQNLFYIRIAAPYHIPLFWMSDLSLTDARSA